MQPVHFGAITKILSKAWADRSTNNTYQPYNEKLEQQRQQHFDQFVASKMEKMLQQHASDPDYEVENYTLREEVYSTHRMPWTLLLDGNDLKNFIKDLYQEEKRVVSHAFELYKEALRNNKSTMSLKVLKEPKHHTIPKAFDWNQATEMFETMGFRYRQDFRDIALTNIIQRYATQATDTILVESPPTLGNT